MLEERDKVRTAGLQLGIPLKPYGFFSRSPEMFARSWTKITHDKGEEEKKTPVCAILCVVMACRMYCWDSALGLSNVVLFRILAYFVSYTSDCFSG